MDKTLNKQEITRPDKQERRNKEKSSSSRWMYPYISKKLVALDLTESADRAFQKIEKMKEPGVIKNLYTEVLMGAFVESIEPNFDENSSTNEIAGSRSKKISKKETNPYWDKKLSIWPKTSVFKETLPVFKKNLEGQFQMAGLMSVMSAFLSFLYIWAVIDERYLINFSVDSVVGIAALFFLFHNMRMQLRLIRSTDSINRYLMLDVAAVLLSFLFRMWLPAGFDVSLAIFIVCFFIEKKWFDQALNKALSF
ncbi:hypothetical protein [Ileibacterium valens]|uniref:hypothetical protein n=1 Tax=Ileibacterium valens TaxID=1862668 RepID=UPI0024B8B65B|nr:hypothetical protein [Ileibacterium valens]